MSISRAALVVVLTLLGGLAGCGDGHTAAPDGAVPQSDSGAGGREFRELCLQVDTYCSRLYACASPTRLSFDQMAFGHVDEASCVVAVGAVLGTYCDHVGDGIDAGRASVDLARLTACTDFRDGLSCEQYVNEDPSTEPLCAGTPFVTGLVASGGACAIDVECATDGDVCSSDGTVLGTCGPLPGAGEACLAGDRCADDLHCDAGICMGTSGDGCLRDSECPGGWCDQPGNDYDPALSGLRGTCTPLRALGDACDDFFSCEGDLYCDDTNGFGTDGLRAPGNCAAHRAAGEPCDEPIDCVSRTCMDDVVCE
jgi:hypothetical protein